MKYAAAGVNDWQPGSRRRVLRNRLGITRVRKLQDAELEAYIRAEDHLIRQFSAAHSFSAEDICNIHRVFLGPVYEWAGHYRDVNLSKGGFPFASALAIPHAMQELQDKHLTALTPCTPGPIPSVAQKIAVVHTEFLLIHPFREGNGRTARLLAVLMAYQAGLPGLSFDFIGSRGGEFQRYVAAIQAGMANNYSPMQAILERAIEGALKNVRSL
jgi:cell filamentation protein